MVISCITTTFTLKLEYFLFLNHDQFVKKKLISLISEENVLNGGQFLKSNDFLFDSNDEIIRLFI